METSRSFRLSPHALDLRPAPPELGLQRLEPTVEVIHAVDLRLALGRVPMAQPPGRETFASPNRASRGAITQKLARMVETRS
jgi:hypothetical protein